MWIAQEVAVILGIRQRKAQHLVTHVLKAITNGLQRGEEVSVRGFGKFYKVYEKPHNKYALYYNAVTARPGRNIIKFEPCKELRYLVNKGYSGPEIVWPPPPFRNFKRKPNGRNVRS